MELFGLEDETAFLFLDGACTAPGEEEHSWSGASVGGVLLNDKGSPLYHFGYVVPEDIVASWGPADKQQYIFEAEVLPFAIALHLRQS